MSTVIQMLKNCFTVKYNILSVERFIYEWERTSKADYFKWKSVIKSSVDGICWSPITNKKVDEAMVNCSKLITICAKCAHYWNYPKSFCLQSIYITTEGMRNEKYFSHDILDITTRPHWKRNAVPLTDTASIWFGD